MQNKEYTDTSRLSESFQDAYGPDGLPKEGGFNAAEILSILRRTDASDAVSDDRAASHKLRNIRDSLEKMHVSGEYFLNFGESALRPEIGREDCERFLPVNSEERTEGFKRTVSFPASGIYAVAGEKLYLAVKSGNNAGAYKHRDTGSFIVYADGKPLLADPGAGLSESCYHNLPTIEGFDECGNPEAETQKFAALDVDLKRKEIFPGVEGYLHSMELRNCYPENAPIETYIREIRFVSDGPVEVTEHLRLRDDAFPHWVLHFISEKEPEYIGEKNVLRIGNLGKISFDRPILGIQVEKIDISGNEELMKNWPDGLFRTNVAPLGGVLRYMIEAL